MVEEEANREHTRLNGEVIYPSPLFSHDLKYLQFLNNILKQTEEASMNNKISFYIDCNDMLHKKVFHDFLMETKRRFIISCSKNQS